MSIVMSRQNEIPIDNESTQLALIPVWDMCNHVEGNVIKEGLKGLICLDYYIL